MKRELTYATVCSGIECMSAAFQDLPMRPVFFAEIEPFPCAVLRHRFPNVPNLGDMSRIIVNEKGEITNGNANVPLPAGGLDVLAGGTPCQDVSNAGLRRGMAEGSGTRSSLAFEFVRLVRELRPRYVVWENVAGVLTDPSFPQFLRAIADCGYGVAYRTLDAQYVRCADIDLPDGGVVRLERAVPQRRRRVWAVGCAGGDVRKASEVLFEPPGVCGDRPPRRVAGQGPARALVGRARVPDGVVGGAAAIASNVIGRSDGCGGNGVGAKDEVAYTLDTVQPQGVAVAASGFDPYEAGGVKSLNRDHAGTVVNGTCPGSHNAVCEVYENHAQDCRVKPCGDVAPTLHRQMGTGGNNVPLAVETFVKVSHAHGADGEGERWARGACAGTRNAIEGGDGRSQECVVETRALSRGEGASPPRAVTNSNGGDVMPTISASEYKQMESQKDKSGGYVLERREPAATHNFECYDNADGVSVTLGARRAKDTLEIEAPACLGFKQNPSAKTRGIGAEREVSPTVTAQFDGAVSIETKQQSLQTSKELAGTVSATDYKEPQAVCVSVVSMRYLVRRLTPTECERLMGLPDGWTLPAFQPVEITDRLVAEFCAIHDAYAAVMAGYAGKPPPKPKTAAWVRKWLERIANPETCPDAPRYKACGNGWATNQPRWILLRILAADGIDPWNGEE